MSSRLNWCFEGKRKLRNAMVSTTLYSSVMVRKRWLEAQPGKGLKHFLLATTLPLKKEHTKAKQHSLLYLCHEHKKIPLLLFWGKIQEQISGKSLRKTIKSKYINPFDGLEDISLIIIVKMSCILWKFSRKTDPKNAKKCHNKARSWFLITIECKSAKKYKQVEFGNDVMVKSSS